MARKNTMKPSEHERGKAHHDVDFIAGWRAGSAAVKRRGAWKITALDARKAQSRVGSKHGTWYQDGYSAAIDSARGAYNGHHVDTARALGLVKTNTKRRKVASKRTTFEFDVFVRETLKRVRILASSWTEASKVLARKYPQAVSRRILKTNPKRRVVRVRAEDHRDFSERMPVRKPRYAGQQGPQRYAKIRYDVTYEIITPESAEEGDVDERGYEHKGLTADSVTDMVRTLRNDGATEASSSHWHKGLWYTAYGDQDYRDGSTTNRSFHIRAPEAVQRLIARAMGVRGA